MKNNRYVISVVVRVIFIGLTSFLLVWLFQNSNRPATTIFLGILLLIEMADLIRYHNGILRDLSNFLVYLQENDATLVYAAKRTERNFSGLIRELNKINMKLQEARLERERQFNYLQAVVKQVDTGILAFDAEGIVDIFNPAARKLLGMGPVHKIDRILELYPGLGGILSKKGLTKGSPVSIPIHGTGSQLAVKMSTLKFHNRLIRLISLQNIQQELDAGELEAWRKLIRIQRHEIVNSITPIPTLTTAIKRMLHPCGELIRLTDITTEHIEDILNSIEVIEDRSKGLIGFMERFRNLTETPTLQIKNFRFDSIADQIAHLFAKQIEERQASLSIHTEPDNLWIRADQRLLEQSLINLVKNSLEALPEAGGHIEVHAFRNQQRDCIIQVKDNGSGIEAQNIESVFVPSFTTKEKGSGIGLSLTRQFIHLHHGSIGLRSVPDQETVFEIILPEQKDN